MLVHAMDRRSVLKSGLLVLGARYIPSVAHARDAGAHAAVSTAWRHGVSHFGELKYPVGFKQFDYVNSNAPKGGSLRIAVLGTFDNFNLVVAGVKGTPAFGIELIHDTLLVPAHDEVSTEYGLLAEAVSYPDDLSSATYRLRAQAKWHDGKPVTPEDVIFSFNAFKKFSPQAASRYSQVAKSEKTGDRDITFTFNGPGNRNLVQVLGKLTILPQHWYEGTGKNGQSRVSETSLDPPMSSGPYRIKEYSPGRSVVFERVKDYWGNEINVNIGRNNFDEIQLEYFRDSTVAIEALKADSIDFRTENSAKNWATAYDFPAAKEHRVILEEFPINNVSLVQGFAFNIRRDKFKDPNVRRAFNYAFDFEKINKEIFFGQYTRISSYFQGMELAATGLPSGRELELLKEVRNEIPPKVFDEVYTNPVADTPRAVRSNLREAIRLFRKAGYEVRNQLLVDAKTLEPFTVEFLGNSPAFERIFLFFKPSLERLGISVTVRTTDQPQYINRLRTWDFDIITYAWLQNLLPGIEQRDNWGSQAADQAGSENVIGIKNPAVDFLIERIIDAKSHADLIAAARALDRVLLWNNYTVPQWSYNSMRTVHWNRFSHPDPMPKYGAASAFPALWWWDAAKAAKTGRPQ
jgi:microcin C transport system substrate-binding protein